MKNSATMNAFINHIRELLGIQYVITDQQQQVPYLDELRDNFSSTCLAVALPSDQNQVAAIVQACNQFHISIVPQGGNTGTCGGTVATSNQLIINLKRLNKIRSVDAKNFTMTVEAGCILTKIKQVAEQYARFFPLDIGAQGSCQIGGNLSTNAGGINVLHYGNTRDLVLGIEVVLADGSTWHGLNSLRKNNTGYNLNNLFIGAEGTLGIITATTLRLFTQPTEQVVAMVALKHLKNGIELLGLLRQASSDRISTYELISDLAMQTVIHHIPRQTSFFQQPENWYILVVLHSTSPKSILKQKLENTLNNALNNKLINNAVIAINEKQKVQMFHCREAIVAAQKFAGKSIKHDISVPLVKIPEFIKRATTLVHKIVPHCRPYPFGHLGDGSLHFNILQPAAMDHEEFLAQKQNINTAIHDLTFELGGSFSAEHGVGLLKTGDMLRYKDQTELKLMHAIKMTLDPNNLLNPGKVLPRKNIDTLVEGVYKQQ